MKAKHKIAITGLFVLGISFVAHAQTTIYDANRWMGSDLNGTARFVGMGGAMGALGGDISTMGTNPAGIGIYRSNDFMLSFGFDNVGSKDENNSSIDKFHGSFDNIGFVLSSRISDVSTLRFVNFGFNYHRSKSFNRNMIMNGIFGTSQTVLMTEKLNYEDGSAELKPWEETYLQANEAYEDPELPWLGLLGYNAYLVNPVYTKNPDDPDNPIFEGYAPYYVDGENVAQSYTSRERGGLSSFDFNVAMNLSDRFYVGATIGIYSIDYHRSSIYSETFMGTEEYGEGGNYRFGNDFWTDGSGVDFKLGFIWRPIEYSSFRIGAAIHTPTFYSIKERNRAYIDYNLMDVDSHSGTTEVMDRHDNPMDGEFKYRLTTPWKFNFSTGYTFGTVAAVGVEYEYMNYASAKLKDVDGYAMEQETADINSMMKGVHTFRAGVEFKLAPEVSFRLGYNHITASMKEDAFKWLPDYSTRTDTEYANRGATNNYTLGFGYSGKMIYVDMAYMYSKYNEDFYAFDNTALSGTKLTNDIHKVIFTLGMRF